MRVCDAIEGTLNVLARRRWKGADALHAVMVNFDNNGRTHYMGNWYNDSMLWTLPEMLDVEAHDLPVTFWGGPPGDRKYRNGTVMDYLMDCCLSEIATGDKNMILYNFLAEIIDRETVRAGAP